MGVIECCRNSDRLDKNFEVRDFFQNASQNALRTSNDFDSKREHSNYKDQNNIFPKKKLNLLEDSNTPKGNTPKIGENDNMESSIKKIQNYYRSYKFRKNFNEKVKPLYQEKQKQLIKDLLLQCGRGGKTEPDDDFNKDDWKIYYPEDERFFLFDKGKVFENQIRILNDKDLEIYEGEMNIENLRHGDGVLTTPHHILRGTWRNNEFTGWGRESRRNGEVLEGKFVNGTINGKGYFKNPDGSLYIGSFDNSFRCGLGELKTNNFEYSGEFYNNMLCGKGKIQFLNDCSEYEGDFLNNRIEGKGIFRWKNGDVYVGEMKNGKMDGYGKYNYKEDGQIYEGYYSNGLKEGHGKLTFPDNKIFEGEFKNGYIDGIGMFFEDGHTTQVEFSKGQFVRHIQT